MLEEGGFRTSLFVYPRAEVNGNFLALKKGPGSRAKFSLLTTDIHVV